MHVLLSKYMPLTYVSKNSIDERVVEAWKEGVVAVLGDELVPQCLPFWEQPQVADKTYEEIIQALESHSPEGVEYYRQIVQNYLSDKFAFQEQYSFAFLPKIRPQFPYIHL